jgi:hypothetical protein
MATFTLQRSDKPDLTAKEIGSLFVAFSKLYVGSERWQHPYARIDIKGNWPAAYKGDGLYLNYSDAAVVSTLRNVLTIKWREYGTDHWHYVKLPAAPTADTGWAELTFITLLRKDDL